jgi:hypothetical protein
VAETWPEHCRELFHVHSRAAVNAGGKRTATRPRGPEGKPRQKSHSLDLARSAIVIALCLLSFAARQTRAEAGQDVPWDTIRQIAQDYVNRESPSDVWFFKRAEPAVLARAQQKVFAHYLDPFPLSFDNLPSRDDYYSLQFLKRDGEKGKYARVGGYLRGRPLPVGPWESPYWRQINYAIEIFRARLIGLDGFQADMLEANSGKYWDALLMLCETAAAVAPGFSIVPEPDMATLLSIGVEDLVHALTTLARSPAVYRLADGRMLVTPFDPDLNPSALWREVIDVMARRNTPIALIPVLLNFRLHGYRFAPFSYGLSSWGVRDPQSLAEDGLADRVYTLRSGHLALMVPVVSQDVRPKSSVLWEAENTRLFRDGWRRAIDENAQFVQLITWNDYSETTEISPSSGTQFVLFDLAGFYTQWLKTGQMPRIVSDAIFYSHRRQIERLGQPPNSLDMPMKLRGSEALHNEIEMIAFLTAPARLEVEIAGRRYGAEVNAGVAELRAPAEIGRPLFRIVRQGTTIVEKLSDWQIEAHPDVEDPSYAGGSSTRPFARVSPAE